MSNIEKLIEQEYQARANLREAEEEYKQASLAIRQKLGAIFEAKRKALGFGRPQTGALLGMVHQKVFSIECPEKVKNPFSVAVYCDMIEAIEKLAEFAPSIPRVKKGRKPKV